LLPAGTLDGTAVLVVTRSAWVASATTSVAVALLFAELGSVTEELTVAVSLIAVPAGVAAATRTFSVNVADPVANVGLLQVIVPALPTMGAEHDHPLGIGVSEKNVVFGGVTSVKDAPVAVLGPALVTTCV